MSFYANSTRIFCTPRVEILINDRTIDTYYHKQKHYIEGRRNSVYKIRVHNDNDRAVAAVVSVDGLSVIDGKMAGADSQKYIIQPFSFIDVKGWRINDNEVREFKFGSRRNSYNQKSEDGNSTDIGVIGVLFYGEKRRYRATPMYMYTHTVGNPAFDYDSYPTFSTSNSLGLSASGSTASMAVGAVTRSLSVNNVGTEQGDHASSRVYHTSFDVDFSTYSSVAIFYDDVKGLEARGIKVKRQQSEPNPFPGLAGYCKSV